MKKKNLDGLPGLTMQGTKGPAGKRGYATFYNYNNQYSLLTQDENDNIKYGELSLGFASSKNDGVLDLEICIPSYSFMPIVNDRVLNTSETGLDLYEVEDVITFSFTLFNNNKKFISIENAETVLKEKITNQESYTFIIDRLNEIVSHYQTYPDLIGNILDNLETYNIYILRKLDSIIFTKQKALPSSEDIEVTLRSKTLSYPYWQKTYYDSDSSLLGKDINYNVSCGKHKYDIILGYENLYKLRDSIQNMADDETDTFRSQINYLNIRIYGAYGDYAGSMLKGMNVTVSGFYLPVVGLNISDNIFSAPDWEVGTTINNVTKIFEETTQSGIIENINTRLNNKHAKIIKISSPGFLDSYYLLDSIDNSPYACMRDPEHIDVYIYQTTENISTDIITATDYYPYIMTDKPVTKTLVVDEDGTDNPEEAIENIGVVQFSVYMPISSDLRDKIAIYAEFTKQNENKYLYIMDTVLDRVWSNSTSEETEREDSENNIQSQNTLSILRRAAIDEEMHPHGYIEKYKDINFDNEDMGDFTMLVKDFEEGNDFQTFYSTKIFPENIINNYNISIFMYYKTSNASYQKIFLGEASMNSSIED